MKIKELRDLTTDELAHKEEELWSEFFGLQVKHALGQLENPILLRRTRRDIARAKTLLLERGVQETSRRRHHVEMQPATPVEKKKGAAKAGPRKKPRPSKEKAKKEAVEAAAKPEEKKSKPKGVGARGRARQVLARVGRRRSKESGRGDR